MEILATCVLGFREARHNPKKINPNPKTNANPLTI